MILVGCCDGPNKTRNGDRYYNIKICAIGGSADTCVNYKATHFNPNGNDLMFDTMDGHTYRFNHAGWAWAIEIK
jgi:hypothetical protein